MITSHQQYSDEVFEQMIENYSLDPSLFNHEAHLRLAWIHVTKYGVENAIDEVSAQLKQFVKHLGAEDKYNHTLTVAAVKAIDHFVQKTKIDHFSDFIKAYPRLLTHFKELMAAHYHLDIYDSQLAKTTYIEPDLKPFS